MSKRKCVNPEAIENQRAATERWHKENTEVLKFSVRVHKGRTNAYNEMARKRGESLAGIVKRYLDGLCRENGIDV